MSQVTLLSTTNILFITFCLSIFTLVFFQFLFLFFRHIMITIFFHILFFYFYLLQISFYIYLLLACLIFLIVFIILLCLIQCCISVSLILGCVIHFLIQQQQKKFYRTPCLSLKFELVIIFLLPAYSCMENKFYMNFG